MKLLLTSGGLRNKTLINALLELAEKPAHELKVAYISTAMNTEAGDKGWAIAQMVQFQKMGVKQIDIVDISSVSKKIWLPRLRESNIIFVNGGNTTHLMTCSNKSGLTTLLPDLLKTRVYVGVSAGSYITTPDTRFNSDKSGQILNGLHLVDFGIQAHYKNQKFQFAKSFEDVKKRVGNCNYPVYAIDDDMAIKIDGNIKEVVGEGEYILFNNKSI